jgi:hypothetical protein
MAADAAGAAVAALAAGANPGLGMVYALIKLFSAISGLAGGGGQGQIQI